MLNELTTAMIFGLIGGAIPGPILTATFTEILQSGFVKSLRVIFVALVAETLVALFCLIVLSSFNLPEYVFRLISLVGAAILVWIALSIWNINKINTKDKMNFSVGKIVVLTLANGALWTFWITISIPRAVLFEQQIPLGSYLFLATIEVGWLIATVFMAFIFSRFTSLLSNKKVIPIMFKLFALLFIYFALQSVYTSVKFFMG